jgi:hypothetical protein
MWIAPADQWSLPVGQSANDRVAKAAASCIAASIRPPWCFLSCRVTGQQEPGCPSQHHRATAANADILERYVPGFQRGNFVDVILNSDSPE